jgi:hypothetical protein
MTLPTMPTKALIIKGIFAVGVVAATATAGVVSFAQAARVSAADNGYGGGVAAIQAAIQAFQNSVHAATTEFNNDINACLNGTPVDAASANTFRSQANAGINQYSAKFAAPSAIDRDQTKMQQRLDAAATAQDTQLTAATDRVSAAAVNGPGLRQCIQSARTDFRSSIREAQQTLRQAIRNALGH